MKKIGILGSTGSIGTQTLEIVRSNPDLQVIALAAGSNVSLMEQQVREFHPMLAVMGSEEAAADLKNRIADTDTRVSAGMEGMLELAILPQMDEMYAIGKAISQRPERGAAVAAAEFLQANFPDRTGFSPCNVAGCAILTRLIKKTKGAYGGR